MLKKFTQLNNFTSGKILAKRDLTGQENKKGFTLIELLVVIAIIGILASIVLVNMNTLRNKAKNVAIKVNMHNLPTAAEFYYEEKGTYWVSADDNVCESSGFKNVKEAVEKLTPLGGAQAKPTPLYCGAEESAWAACIILNVEHCYCVDSLGNKVEAPYDFGTCVSVCPYIKEVVDNGTWTVNLPHICGDLI